MQEILCLCTGDEILLTRRQRNTLSNLWALFVAIFILIFLYGNIVKIEQLEAANKIQSYELEQVRSLLNEKTHPAKIQQDAIDYILRQGKFTEL